MWKIGERISNDGFSRRWVVFKYLGKSVIEYGVDLRMG